MSACCGSALAGLEQRSFAFMQMLGFLVGRKWDESGMKEGDRFFFAQVEDMVL